SIQINVRNGDRRVSQHASSYVKVHDLSGSNGCHSSSSRLLCYHLPFQEHECEHTGGIYDHAVLLHIQQALIPGQTRISARSQFLVVITISVYTIWVVSAFFIST
ncbi:hypothetical protein PENTCL1PPCAC_14152, partial [Pristionchus entomophagus]